MEGRFYCLVRISRAGGIRGSTAREGYEHLSSRGDAFLLSPFHLHDDLYPAIDRVFKEASQAMKRIKAQFEEFFDLPFPKQMLYDGRLIPINYSFEPYSEWFADDASLLVSEVALQSPLPVIMSLMDSFHSALEGYYFVGFYDRGMNNFGFFYARVDSWRKVYFRFNYAGLYQDSDREKKKIREFLPRYFEFEQKLECNVRLLKVLEGVPGSKYTLTLPDNQTFEKEFIPRDALFEDPNFDEKFSDVLGRLS
jgi:hypothetical protein